MENCKPTYKGKRYNSLEELYRANGVNEQQKQQAQQIYSEYLNTIFPNSKVKDIVYHGSNTKFEEFLEDNLNYFGTQEIAKGYGKNIYPVLIEIKKPYYEDGGNLSNQSYEDLYDKLDNSGADGFISNGNNLFVPKEPEQIHVLGSKQDIEGFKAFVESNNTKTNNSELIDKNTESEIKPIVDAENKTIKNNYETFKEAQDFFDSNLSTMDNVYNAIFNNSEITPDDIIKQIIKTDNVEKECNGGVSDSNWEIV